MYLKIDNAHCWLTSPAAFQASIDSESQRLVQDALEKLMKGPTSIVIAHRLSTIRQADKILVLDNGQIIEQGTHEELLQLEGGLYRNLSGLQFAG